MSLRYQINCCRASAQSSSCYDCSAESGDACDVIKEKKTMKTWIMQ